MEAVCSYSEMCRSDLQRSERRHKLDIIYEKVFEICTRAFSINLADLLIDPWLDACWENAISSSAGVFGGTFQGSESDVTQPSMVTHFLNSHSAFTHPIHYLRVAPYLTLDRSEIKAVMIEGQRI